MRNSQIEIYSNKHAEMINNLNDNRLNYYIVGIIEEIAEKDNIELEKDNILDVSDENLKLEALEGIFESIEREEDKILFATAISENASLLGMKIADEFTNKLNVLKNAENIEEPDISENSNEEPEEEPELEQSNPNFDSDSDTNTEESSDEEEPEQDKEQNEQSLEGPAITEYKAKTVEMEKELEELMAKLGTKDEDSKEIDDIINNTIYPEIEEYENKVKEVTIEIENIDKEIATKTEEKERYEKLKEDYNSFYEERAIPKTEGDYRQKMDIYDKRIKDCANSIKSNVEKKNYKEQELDMLNKKNQEVSGPLYKIEVWKLAELYNKEVEKLENNLKELNEIQDNLYKESKGIPLEIYGMKTKLENQIKEMKDVFTRTVGIRSDINLNNPEFKPIIDALKNGRKINGEVNEELNNKFRVDNKDLNELAEKLRDEIEKRKENIAKYYDALNDIKNLGNLIKTGKTPEELNEDIEKINNKINTITDDKLKEELRGELNKILNPEKEQEKEEPEKPGPVKKDPNKWKKWVSGLAGLALGAGIIGLTPLGLPGALVIAAGTQLVKKGVNKAHEKLKNENEVTNIEKTGKLAKFKEKIKSWLKDENIVKNINWFLNGTAIGAISMGAIEQITALTQTATPTNVPEQPSQPNIKVGDSTSGMDLSQGYDSPQLAINGTNPEALNQGIMNDGQTVIRRIMDAQGNTYMSTDEALKAGKSLSELTFDTAQGMNLNPALDRAWVNAAEAMGGRTL